jgi:hypothetical protein
MRQRKRRAGLGLLVLLAGAGFVVGLHGCREPTQVTVDIRTLGIDCTKELRNIAIAVGRTAEVAEEVMGSAFVTTEVTSCESATRVGTLVITPETNTGAIVVAASYTEQRCVPPRYDGCVVARRRFTFVEHTKLTLPVTLEASCRNVPCGTFSSCRSGTCTDSDTACAADGACRSGAEPVFGPDGGDPNGDSGVPTDSDAGDGGSQTVGGNACPPAATIGSPGPFTPGMDCHPGGCCGYMFFSCVPQPSGTCTMGAPVFGCTGRKHCGAGYCCGRPGSPGSSACSNDPNGCNIAGYVPVCNTNADCPPGTACTQTFQMRGNGQMKSCQ